MDLREETKLRIRNLFDRGVNFHPENDFSEYVNIKTNEPTFTKEEADELNRLVEECYEAEIDMCELALEVWHESAKT